jgi:hypothetical protein
MLNSLLNSVFRCTHRRTTFPLTPARKAGFSALKQRHATYVVCLDCGKEFGYDWSEMRRGQPVAARVAAVTELSTAER